jgi:hypothetical protein
MRKYVITAAVAVAAAGLTVGLTLATRTHVPKRAALPSGRPPLALDLGVRTDPEAVALRQAATEYNAGKVKAAGAVFGRYGSLQAQVGADLSAWPGGFDALQQLAATHPHDSLVQLHYGLGLYWRGDQVGARSAWRKARRSQPDTQSSLKAEDLLYPNFPRGLPTFVPSFPPPAAVTKLSPPQQLAYLRAHATDAHGDLLYGVALQRLGRQVSALHAFEQAGGVEGQVASAVARFDKANPSATFSRLGPLAKRYPQNQSVRFHLGLCLLWLAEVKQARKELQLARAAGPATPLGREAAQFLNTLRNVGSR